MLEAMCKQYKLEIEDIKDVKNKALRDNIIRDIKAKTTISVRDRDNGNKTKMVTLEGTEFICRFLMHSLKPVLIFTVSSLNYLNVVGENKYDSENRLVKIDSKSTGKTGRELLLQSTQLEYDNRGNLVNTRCNGADISQYTYDAANKLVEVQRQIQ